MDFCVQKFSFSFTRKKLKTKQAVKLPLDKTPPLESLYLQKLERYRRNVFILAVYWSYNIKFSHHTVANLQLCKNAHLKNSNKPIRIFDVSRQRCFLSEMEVKYLQKTSKSCYFCCNFNNYFFTIFSCFSFHLQQILLFRSQTKDHKLRRKDPKLKLWC